MPSCLKLDPAEAVLDLKVLDPAMGSGHFLVTAVDFLSDYVASLIEYAPAVPDWLDGEYASPLVERVAAIRGDILQRARDSDWVIDEAQLTDQAIIRRMVLKRCIYGVDKNPLTVELAKVSLWLHSFTVGAPLSFLDHHLRCGDSLLGLRVLEATEELNRFGGLFASSAIAGAEAATEGMQRIEEMSDADVAEVRESAELFLGVEATTADLRGLLDLLCGMRWSTAGMTKKDRTAFESPLVDILGQQPENAYSLLAKGPDAIDAGTSADEESSWSGFKELWNDARSTAAREGFLHWEVAFPGVWHGWQNIRPQGGFDAVIGNPPWDRIKLQEVEWFATRDSPNSPCRDCRRKKGWLSSDCETKVRPWRRSSTLLKKGRTNSANWSASRATTPCSAAATSSSTRCSSSGLWLWSSPTALWVCLRPRASTPTRRPPLSSSPFPPADGWPVCSTSRTGVPEQSCHPFSQDVDSSFQILRPDLRRRRADV